MCNLQVQYLKVWLWERLNRVADAVGAEQGQQGASDVAEHYLRSEEMLQSPLLIRVC